MSKILVPKFGPLGLTWGPWGQDLRRGPWKYFQMLFSYILRIQIKLLTMPLRHHSPKNLNRLQLGVDTITLWSYFWIRKRKTLVKMLSFFKLFNAAIIKRCYKIQTTHTNVKNHKQLSDSIYKYGWYGAYM